MTDLQAARDMTFTMFSGLWMHPRATYAFCPAAKVPELSEKMKARAEAFIAQEIGAPVEIETSDDLEFLRSIYRICKRVDASEIRDWAKAREKAEKAFEREAARAARKAEKEAAA
jgi:hypothetical protein